MERLIDKLFCIKGKNILGRENNRNISNVCLFSRGRRKELGR